MRSLKTLCLLALIAALSGCATSWVVDSEVNSHSKLQNLAPGASYRFERLPSQSESERARQAQSELEAMAAPALAAAGLRQDDAAPRYSVQVNARVMRVASPWDDPWMRGGWGHPWYPGWGWHGSVWYGGGWNDPFFGPPPQPWYLREVSVIMRELPGNTVVYESRARHDGPYNISAHVLPVMFSAALQGFPNPPAGVRRVDIPLGGAKPAGRP